MPTIKKRLNITIPKDLEEVLKLLSKRDNVPQATKITELLRSALMVEEDIALSRIGNHRDFEGAVFVEDTNEVWK